MPRAKILLQHELFVLDADLLAPPDSDDHEAFVRRLVNALLRALDMYELGPLMIYPATDQRNNVK